MSQHEELLELLITLKNSPERLKNTNLTPLRRYVNGIVRYIKRDDREDVFNAFLYNIYQSDNLPQQPSHVPLFIRSRVLNALTDLGHIRDTRYRSGNRIRPTLQDESVLDCNPSEDAEYHRAEVRIEFDLVFGGPKPSIDWEKRKTLFD